ncbi:hypothetical protein KW807_00755 [Candidatus Parcubacteria bacterium]|nr:hypothetical protein [Candidatus Parcubacteria bacterium]
MNTVEEKIIMYLGGGAMSGCYGAGVLKGLYDQSGTSSIEAVYTGSVGALNAAYLLSDQVEIGPTIYFEDLQHGFILPFNLFRGTLDLVFNRFIYRIKEEKAHNVVNVNYICEIITTQKHLDFEKIRNNPIELYVKILNVETGEVEYKSFKDHPNIDLLKAAIAIKPYFFGQVSIDENMYVDGTIKEPIGIQYILKKYPNKKIVVVLNEPIERRFRHYLKNFVEGLVSSLYPYKISLYKLFMEREDAIRKDIQVCLNNKNVLLLYPNFRNRTRPRTTELAVIRETFDAGVRDSKKIINFLNTTYEK